MMVKIFVAELAFTTSSPTKMLERTAAADSSFITTLCCRRCPFFGLSKKQHVELEVLDAVALYLDRNGDEGTVAVAIDKDSVAFVSCWRNRSHQVLKI